MKTNSNDYGLWQKTVLIVSTADAVATNAISATSMTRSPCIAVANVVTLKNKTKIITTMANENFEPFFIKGTTYRCIKGVKDTFTVGKTYCQHRAPTEWFGWLTNDKGCCHSWPQPENVKHEAMIWDTTPESMDPRLYFEPVIKDKLNSIT